MVYIPLDKDWSRIEAAFRRGHPGDCRKKLPIREVAAWFAEWISRTVLPEKGF